MSASAGLQSRVRYFALFLAVLLAMPYASAQMPSPDVKVSLLASCTEVTPGGNVLVGVLLDLPEGWHVYWKNPGDSGLATSVAWHTPDGFAVSDLMWPVPTRFVQAGDIEGFGYEGQVMLMARVTPPPGYRGNARIEADTRWLACKEVCVPGRARVEAVVEVGAQSRPANERAFAEWKQRVPVDAGTGSTSAAVHKEGLRFDLTIQGLTAAGEPAVFVAPPEGFTVRRSGHAGDNVMIEFSQLPGTSAVGKAEVVVAKQDKAVRILLPLP